MRPWVRVSPLLNHGTALNSFSVLPGRHALDINFNETLWALREGFISETQAKERSLGVGTIFTS